MGGTWAAMRTWARADLRARWASIVAVGVLAGVTAGLALGCIVGAERTSSVLDRLNEATNASDALLFTSAVGLTRPDWTTLEARPEVAELAPWALVFGELEGEPGLLFAPVGDEWMQEVDRPVVVEGRMFDPAADDEMVIAEGAAELLDVELGDAVPFVPDTHADAEQLEGGGRPTGPRLTVEVVGIIRTPLEALFVDDGLAVVSPGLLAQHPEVEYLENSVVQLDEERGDVFALQRHVDSDVLEGTPLLDLQAVQRRVTTTTDVERTVLLILAGTIALVGLVLVGQVVGRSAAGAGEDARTLRAIGLTRRGVATASTIAHVPALALGAAATAAMTVATTAFLPFGLADRLEPDPGVRVDVVPIVAGAAGLSLALAAGTFWAAWAAASPRPTPFLSHRAGFVGWVRRNTSPAVGLGTTMALRRTQGRNGVPVRPALAGAVVGVLGVTAAVTVDAGLRDAIAHPERAGVAWDAQVTQSDPESLELAGIDPAFAATIAVVPGVDDVAVLEHGATAIEQVGLQVYALREVRERSSEIELVTIEGRGPRAPGEAALGPDTADALGVEVGDHVTLGPANRELRVVGLALFPSDVHAEFNQGLWLDPTDLDLAVPSGTASEMLVVRFTPGVDETEELAALQAVAGRSGGVAEPAPVPPEVENLRDVLPLPRWLAAFLALLAIAAALHVLVASARACRRDFAVLRAIGMTRRGTRLVLNVQGVAIFAAGLAIGVPLGVAGGRMAWRLIAASVPLDEVMPFAAVAIALLVPVTILVSQAIAAGPGRQLSRLRPAEVLRSE